jgi:hypothetical protein
MMNGSGLEGHMYDTDMHPNVLDMSLKEEYEKLKVTMKDYSKVLIPHYKNRLTGMWDMSRTRYPLTTLFGIMSLIMTPLAAVLDPRPGTFAVSLGMVAFGYMTDIMGGAPHPYKPDE